MFHRHGTDGMGQFSRLIVSGFCGGASHDDDKLLASKTTDHIAVAEMPRQHTGHGFQSGIAGFVAMSVVKAFEMIDIHHQQ